MPQTTIGRGNILYDFLVSPTLAWSQASVASTTVEATATVPGLQVGDYVDMFLGNAALVTGLAFTNCRVSAANTLAVTFTATSVTATLPTTGWILNVCRPEAPNNLPTTAA